MPSPSAKHAHKKQTKLTQFTPFKIHELHSPFHSPSFAMKTSHKFAFSSSSSSTTTVTYTFHDDHSTHTTNEIPIHSPSQPPTPITVHLPQQLQSEAATKMQSLYRAHRIRTLYKIISSVDSEANRLQRLIQLQETVDSIRSDEREKLKMNEALMSLLLKLDSVPGIDPSIREARRKVSHRIVGLQEILDGISEARIDDYDDDYGGWGPCGYWRNLDKVVEQMEEQVCRERGGDELEKFCAQHLGFRCLQRFLRD